ncbi:MAG: HypC/HybG/HupF family hydrogenase formation chaperone [Candidatus Bipolaricaulota bacterium]
MWSRRGAARILRGDENVCLAVPMKVAAVEGNVATLESGGVRTCARLDALGEPISAGDYLLVHAGFAIRRLEPDDAQETLRLLDELLAAGDED